MSKVIVMRAGHPRALCALAAVALSACQASEPPQPPSAPPQAGPNLSRPCELLTPSMAAEISGEPFFRTIISNAINEGVVICDQAVGAGGAVGAVRAAVHLPQTTGPAELRFAALCRGEEASRLHSSTLRIIERIDPAPQAADTAAPPPPVSSMCHLPRGGYAALLGDRVIEVGYQRFMGTIDDPVSLQFAIALTTAAGQ